MNKSMYSAVLSGFVVASFFAFSTADRKRALSLHSASFGSLPTPQMTATAKGILRRVSPSRRVSVALLPAVSLSRQRMKAAFGRFFSSISTSLPALEALFRAMASAPASMTDRASIAPSVTKISLFPSSITETLNISGVIPLGPIFLKSLPPSVRLAT